MSWNKGQPQTLLSLLSERGKVVTLAVLQIYLHGFLRIDQDLAEAERRLSGIPPVLDQKSQEGLVSLLADIHKLCGSLNFNSTQKQIDKIRRVSTSGVTTKSALHTMFVELRNRFNEDTQNFAFYAVTDQVVLLRFFRANDEPGWEGCLLRKCIEEIFDAKIILCFPEMTDDLEAAVDCYIHDCFSASVFHLMRVVEFALMRTAKLAEITDPKPSWGAVLQQLEKLALNTKYTDLPVGIQPHREFIKNLLPKMHAIQHAWRNKIDHVGYKLVPAGEIGGKVAMDIMNAIESFLLTLTEEFPLPSTLLSPVTAPSG
ncbi:MAG TPA: hypothetical protein VKQ11_06595 [Candidatus Sulfotelmatobacter sp.]|nr:hypothetical protein [Candidatus Sulfotelmatobacter sp.]